MIRRLAGAGLLAGWLLAAPEAFAQAWAPPAGSGSVAMVLQGVDNTGHVRSNGTSEPVGKSRSASLYLEVDYALNDRLSLAAGLPFVLVRYLGPPPPPGTPEPPMVQPVDECYCWQQDFQDFGLTARYNVLNGATALTTSLSLGVPSHAYEYVGEAVVGRRLRELRLAVDVGRRLDFVTPRLAVSARYAYTFVEQVLGVSTNRSNVSAEIGFQALDRLSLSVTMARQVTHGGLRTGTEKPPSPDGYPWGEITSAELFREHDRLLRDNQWHLGAGLTYSFSAADVFASYLEFTGGSDTHDGRALTVGVSVPFAR